MAKAPLQLGAALLLQLFYFSLTVPGKVAVSQRNGFFMLKPHRVENEIILRHQPLSRRFCQGPRPPGHPPLTFTGALRHGRHWTRPTDCIFPLVFLILHHQEGEQLRVQPESSSSLQDGQLLLNSVERQQPHAGTAAETGACWPHCVTLPAVSPSRARITSGRKEWPRPWCL